MLSKVKKLRMERGLDQWQLAQKVGLSESALSRIENGRKYPKKAVAKKIATFLECSVEEVVEHFPQKNLSGNGV